MTFPTTGILDDFNRADGTLGANWVIGGNFNNGTNTGLNISGGKVVHGWTVGGDGGDVATWVADQLGPDLEFYTKFGAAINPNQYNCTLVWRWQDYASGVDNYQLQVVDDDGTGTTLDFTLAKNIGGVWSGIDFYQVAHALAAGDQIGVRMTGADITVFLNGAVVGTAADSDITTAGYVALEIADGNNFYNSISFDDFGGGTIGLSAPVADFSGTPVSGAEPLTVDFTDASANTPTSWLWDFGDGSTSTAQDPTHVYAADGIYTVALTASNADGSDTERKVYYITVTAAIMAGGGSGGGSIGEIGVTINGDPVDLSGDMRATTPITIEYGIHGSGPAERVASTGTLTFALDNSEHNSAHLLGYYSPGHANCLAGFEVGLAVSLAITYKGVTYAKFRGTIETIDPDSGQYLTRATHVQAVDWMDEAAKQKVRLMPVQVNRPAGKLVGLIAMAMTRQPIATLYAAGDSVFPYSLDNARDEKSTAMSEFQKLALSELGYLFIKGDTSTGGVLTFQARSTRPSLVASQVTIDDTMTGLRVTRQRSRVYNLIRVTTHPRRVDADATTVLFALTGAPKIASGQSILLVGQYRDPAQKSVRCGGMDMVTPVPATDYAANTASDGSGSDLTGDFGVTANFGGNGVQLQIANTGGVDGYLTLMQCRGRGVYDDNEIVSEAFDNDSIGVYSENILSIDMAFQADPRVGQDAADYLLSVYKDPHTAIESVEFIGNSSVSLMTAGLALEPGDRITIRETVTGVDADYIINGVAMTIYAGGIYRFNWIVAPMAQFEQTGVWLLGVVDRGEIGENTTLGY
jgi:PKD repeat protein